MNIPNPFIIMAHFDLVGLSTESKPTNVKDGSTYFEVNTSNLYIFYKGTWYLQGEQEETQEVSNVQNAPLNNVISIPKELGKIEPTQEIIEPAQETENVENEEIEEVQEIEEVEEGEE